MEVTMRTHWMIGFPDMPATAARRWFASTPPRTPWRESL